MANQFSKCPYFKVGSTDLTAYLAGVPIMRRAIQKQDLTTGEGKGTKSGGDQESHGIEWAVYNDAADVVGSVIRPLHKKYVDVEIQYGEPTAVGTAGNTKRDDIIYKANIFVEVDSAVPAGPVGSAEMWAFQSDVQGLIEEDDGQ